MLAISRNINPEIKVVLHPEFKKVNVWSGTRIIESRNVKPYYEGQFEIIYNEYKKKYK